MKYKVIVIGGGAAGLMAAGRAGEVLKNAADKTLAGPRKGEAAGPRVLLLEKNEKVGRKIGISGKGRCNVTNIAPLEEAMRRIPGNHRFLYHAFSRFHQRELCELLEKEGCRLKVERGGRVFPVSDRSFDVIDALLSYVKKQGVSVHTQEAVLSVKPFEGGYLVKTGRESYFTESVIVATGGLSYPATGSTGDGYEIAKSFEVAISPLRPGLVGLVSSDPCCEKLTGLSLRNIRMCLEDAKKKKTIYEDFGELLFTHFGISGPTVLSASSYLAHYMEKRPEEDFSGIAVRLDLKPALTLEMLDLRMIRDFEKYKMRSLARALEDLMPKALIDIVLQKAGVDGHKKTAEVSRKDRQTIGRLLKSYAVPITGFRSLEEAIVTIGGVKVSELSSQTMMSQKHPGLFFAGEVLDVDGVTGGFNLQIAFSTGHLAGESAASYLSQDQTEKNNIQKEKKMINVAIDGPGGAGKSTVAKSAARRMGLQYLDTGALYRGVAVVLLRKGIDLDDQAQVEEGIRGLKIHLDYDQRGQRVIVNGEDITDSIRSMEAGQGASKVSVHGAVRELLLDIQQAAAKEFPVIMDGRDIGTVILPDADVKIYMTASVEERAHRRLLQLEESGVDHGDLEEIMRQIEERDYRDTHREIAPLRQAEDAVLIDSTHMGLSEVVDKVCELIQEAKDRDC